MAGINRKPQVGDVWKCEDGSLLLVGCTNASWWLTGEYQPATHGMYRGSIEEFLKNKEHVGTNGSFPPTAPKGERIKYKPLPQPEPKPWQVWELKPNTSLPVGGIITSTLCIFPVILISPIDCEEGVVSILGFGENELHATCTSVNWLLKAYTKVAEEGQLTKNGIEIVE